jgi:hypothetical protein
VLYVGRARDLRARLRSYFRTERQRPAVEAALGALERVEWRVLGSELEAGLEELRPDRELSPAGEARSPGPTATLPAPRAERLVRTDRPDRTGRSRAAARAAARALDGVGGEPRTRCPRFARS